MFVAKTQEVDIKSLKNYKRVKLMYGEKFIKVPYEKRYLFFTKESLAKFQSTDTFSLINLLEE